MLESEFRRKLTQAPVAVRELWEKGSSKGDFMLSRVKQAGKGLLVEATERADRRGMGATSFQFFGPTSKIFAYYPRPEHAEAFAHSLIQSHGSPGDEFPGSVGTMHVRRWGKEINIEVVQGSFRQELTPQLTRGIAAKYGGWRHHLISHVFDQALAENAARVVFVMSQRKGSGNARVFREIAKKYGFATRKARNKNEIVGKRITAK